MLRARYVAWLVLPLLKRRASPLQVIRNKAGDNPVAENIPVTFTRRHLGAAVKVCSRLMDIGEQSGFEMNVPNLMGR